MKDHAVIGIIGIDADGNLMAVDVGGAHEAMVAIGDGPLKTTAMEAFAAKNGVVGTMLYGVPCAAGTAAHLEVWVAETTHAAIDTETDVLVSAVEGGDAAVGTEVIVAAIGGAETHEAVAAHGHFAVWQRAPVDAVHVEADLVEMGDGGVGTFGCKEKTAGRRGRHR